MVYWKILSKLSIGIARLLNKAMLLLSIIWVIVINMGLA